MSSSRRVQKAAAAIRQVVSMAILTEMKDPRVKHVTVTLVEVMPDMRQAKVHVSIMGDEKKQGLALHGLRSAAGFLQSKIAERIDTRYTPKLEFVLDQGVKHSLAVAEILQRVLPKDDDEILEDEDEDVEGEDEIDATELDDAENDEPS